MKHIMNNRVQELYETIKAVTEEIEAIRKQCKHEDTHMSNYEWAPIHVSPEQICNECGAVVITMQEDKYHM